MAWTKQQAERIAREQTEELIAEGRTDVVCCPQFIPEMGGWIVEGAFKSELAKDPIWGPIAGELGLLLGLPEGEK